MHQNSITRVGLQVTGIGPESNALPASNEIVIILLLDYKLPKKPTKHEVYPPQPGITLNPRPSKRVEERLESSPCTRDDSVSPQIQSSNFWS